MRTGEAPAAENLRDAFMTRSTQIAACIALLVFSASGFAADQPAPVLAEGDCQAPFDLLVPAEVVRAAGGLTVIAHDDGAGARLSFAVGLEELVVTLQGNDGPTELGRVAARLPGEGGLVLLKHTPGGVAVAYDATTVLRLDAELPDGGRWGVLGAPAEVLDEIMFQPVDEVIFGDDFMRVPGQPATWDQLSGDWRVAQLESSRYSANAFTLLGNASGGGAALAAAGYWFWEDLTVEASVRATGDAHGFGVGLACQPDGGGYVVRFLRRDGASGVAQLVRVRGGEESVLDEAPAVAHPDEWHRMAISGVAGQLTGALDGVKLVSADDPELAQGQVSLWVGGRDPVAFDDVQAYSGPMRVDTPVVLAQSQDPAEQVFVNDQYMQEWADERDQWLAGAGGIWHAGHYWGDVELAWEMSERGLGDGVELHLCAPTTGPTLGVPADAQAGCHLALAAAEGKLALTLREGAEVRAEAAVAMPELPVTVALRRTGDAVEALVGGEVAASFDATIPAAGKVGLTGRTARRLASELRIISRNTIDATFRSAPTDWHVGSGEWGVSSRWDCTPRWSWFQGRSDDLASVWTRSSFEGDVVVEFFAGISMDQPWAPFYQHPGNLCVTLCGSNDTPGSGYSLIFGGWGNSAVGIFRQGELVARVPGFTMPDILNSLGGTSGREDAHKLHNEWWRIRAERVGSTVRLLVGGKLAAEFDDPDPLPGGAVGVWTLNQAMTVARARVYYEQGERTLASAHTPTSVAPAPGLPVPEFQPRHRASTFEAGVEGWRSAAPGACEVTLVERNDGGRCLEVSNPTAGGNFALAAPFGGVDLRDHSLLAFDYAVPDDVRVDVFATIGGQRHRVALTGPEGPVAGIEDAGRVADVRAGGRWGEARVDLLGLLRPFVAGDGPVVLDALEFAAYAAPEYMRAGIGGNPAGASWRLDNVYLGGVTADPVTLGTQRDVTVTVRGCTVGAKLRGGRAEHRVTPHRSGLVSVTIASGAREATDLVAFDLDAPEIEALEPQPDAAWLGPTLSVRVADAGPAGMDERSLELRIGDRRVRYGDDGLRWDASLGLLTLDLRAAGLTLTPDKPVKLRAAASDRAGNRADALELAFTPQLTADTTPPTAPALAGLPQSPLDCDFEADAGPIEPWGVDASVALRRARGATEGNPGGGSWCLEARCTKLGGLFGVSLGCAPFEASRYPVLEFDYRASDELRVDLIVQVDGTRRVVKFTDNDQTWRSIGGVGASADGQWHHATIDLHAMLARAFGRSAPLAVTDIFFATSGWPGNRADTRWWLDNVRLLPALDANALPEGLALSSRDESGVAGFAWVADEAPGTEPPAEVTTGDLSTALAGLAGTGAWLHAAAIDAAGNRSPVAHIPLRPVAYEDTAPPVASAATPADGAQACPGAISVTVTDEGAGVSPADLALTVNGRWWRIADEALAWDSATGLLMWELPPGESLGEDGARVRCMLDARDLAGNALAPLEWAFALDYAADTEAPPAPIVSYVPANVADDNDFEAETGGWGNFVAGQVVRRAEGGATGPGCVALRHLGGRGNGFVLARDFGDGWREHPVVRFRYRTDSATRARLQVLGTTFDGSRDRWTELGTLPISGNGWLTAELDVAKVLARTSPSLDIHRIFLSVDLPSDGVLLVDDYAMYSRVATEAGFRWAAPVDPSGIAGYSWVLDAAADTVPPEKITGLELSAQFADLEPGHHVFHVRAWDGAGNWSAPTHVPFDLQAASE